jgi:hypothetical protein
MASAGKAEVDLKVVVGGVDFAGGVVDLPIVVTQQEDTDNGVSLSVVPDWIAFKANLGNRLRDIASGMPYFPDLEAKCSAHGDRMCGQCAQNPSTCAEPDGQCGTWLSTGMHWDTCPNRVRGF